MLKKSKPAKTKSTTGQLVLRERPAKSASGKTHSTKRHLPPYQRGHLYHDHQHQPCHRCHQHHPHYVGLGLEWVKLSSCRHGRTLILKRPTLTFTCHQCLSLFQPQMGRLKVAGSYLDALAVVDIQVKTASVITSTVWPRLAQIHNWDGVWPNMEP